MANPDSYKNELTVLKNYFWSLLILWTALVAAILTWSLLHQKHDIREMAIIQARDSFQKDLVYRRWAASHGGVYVPVTDKTPPNPYLSHLAERDITTASGRTLTLINPAYMTRQVHELGLEYGPHGHITSLNPIRAANAPDPWEAIALHALQSGEKEVTSIEPLDNAKHMRLMGPLVTEQACLTCHAQQGYKVGDLRGGISISIPMAPIQAVARQNTATLAAGHGLLWLLGVGGISLARQRFTRRIHERQRAEKQIRDLAKFPSENPNPVLRVAQDGSIVYSNQACGNLLAVWGQADGKILSPHACQLVRGSLDSGRARETEVECGNQVYSVWLAPVLDDQHVNIYALDITERMRAEQELTVSERKYRSLFDDALDMIHIVDTNGKIVDANRLELEVMGYSKAEYFGKPLLEIIHPDYRATTKDMLKQALRGKAIRAYETALITKKGEKVIVEVNATPQITQGQITSARAIARDIGKRKQAEETLQEARDGLERHVRERTAELSRTVADLQQSQDRLADAQRIAHLGNWHWDIVKDELSWSDQIYNIFGLKPQQFDATYAAFLACVHPDDRKIVEQAVDEALRTHKPYSIDHRIIRPDGEERIVHERAEVTFDSNGQALRMMGTVQDITTRKNTEHELLAYQKQLQILASELTLAEEHQRRNLAENLHDQVGQLLAAAKMKLEFLTGFQQSDDHANTLDSVLQLLHQAIQYTRSLTFELSPPALYALGFEAALARLAEQMTDLYAMNCRFEHDGILKPMDKEVKVLLYRVVQELLHNVGRHAAAREVKISLSTTETQIQIVLEDDGVGFDPKKFESNAGINGGFGLFSARERLNYINGNMTIRSARGHGAKTVITAPLKKPEQSQEEL